MFLITLGIIGKGFVAMIALAYLFALTGNTIQGNSSPWWLTILTSFFIVLWGYLEYYL